MWISRTKLLMPRWSCSQTPRHQAICCCFSWGSGIMKTARFQFLCFACCKNVLFHICLGWVDSITLQKNSGCWSLRCCCSRNSAQNQKSGFFTQNREGDFKWFDGTIRNWLRVPEGRMGSGCNLKSVILREAANLSPCTPQHLRGLSLTLCGSVWFELSTEVHRALKCAHKMTYNSVRYKLMKWTQLC